MKRMRLTAMTLCWVIASHAQTEPASPWLEEVSVTGRREAQPTASLLGAASQVNAAVLERVGHVHLQEVAVRIPGVWLSRGNGQEMLVAVRSPVYTGAGSCGEVLIAENGVPIRPSGLCNVNQLFEVNTEQARGLEVWRGAGTVFYGSNAVHGVINTLPPALDSRSLSLEAGSQDFYRLKWSNGVRTDNQSLHFALHGTSAGDVKDHAGVDQQKMSLQHRYQASTYQVSSLLSATNLNQETSGFIRGKGAYALADWKDNPNPEAYREASSVRISTRIENRVDSQDTHWQVTPYYRRSKMRFLQHYLPGQPWEENGQTSAGVMSSIRWMPESDLTLWFGAEAEVASMQVKEYQADVFISAGNPRFQGAHYDFSVDSDLLAVFVNSEWQWREHWFAELGLRYERLNYDYDNQLLSGTGKDDGTTCGGGACRYLRLDDREDRFANVSGHVGVRTDLANGWHAYTRLARAYRAPQINERYRLLAGQSAEEFDKKQIDSLEFGVRYEQDTMRFRLSSYYMRKEDAVLSASNNATVGDGETDHLGVEWELDAMVAERWQLTTAISWAKHEIKSASLLAGKDVSGNVMDTAPRWMGSVQIGYLATQGWRAELEMSHLGEYFVDAENEHRYPGHTIWNGVLQWPIAPQWQGRLRLQNLFDKRYAERADYAFGDYRYFTGQPRGAYLEIRHQW